MKRSTADRWIGATGILGLLLLTQAANLSTGVSKTSVNRSAGGGVIDAVDRSAEGPSQVRLASGRRPLVPSSSRSR